VNCKELERYTFTDPGVRAALAGMITLRADVTANDDADQALLKRFGIVGPPAILFFGPDGRERREYRVVGFLDAARFNEHLRSLVGRKG
jgi:thiol:disulfide interchange protein DsbD